MKLRRMPIRFLAVVVLYLGLVMCVLGRRQPSPFIEAPSHHAAIESLGVNHGVAEAINSSGSTAVGRLPHRLFSILTQKRRALKGSGGKGSGGSGRRGSGSSGGGGGGAVASGNIEIIIISVVGFLVLTGTTFLVWRRITKRNPNWRFRECFKRRKPATEKLMTALAKSDADQDAVHRMTVDVSRLDHIAKSRKQASLHK